MSVFLGHFCRFRKHSLSRKWLHQLNGRQNIWMIGNWTFEYIPLCSIWSALAHFLDQQCWNIYRKCNFWVICWLMETFSYSLDLGILVSKDQNCYLRDILSWKMDFTTSTFTFSPTVNKLPTDASRLLEILDMCNNPLEHNVNVNNEETTFI